MPLKSIQQQIQVSGKLTGGESHWERSAFLRGKPKKTLQAMKPHLGKGDAPFGLAVAGASKSVTLGDGPKGFGQGFIWDRQDAEILLVLFINAADPLGVSIDGLQPGDTLLVSSAAGLASFAEDTGNPLAGSLVGLIAAGAKIGSALAGVPEAVPFVGAAEEFAKDQFKATNVKNKRRDAFGVDPKENKMARQEGGILVCLPDAGGTYYSGNGDHEERWIKKPGDRVDKNRPPHVVDAFFPIQGDTNHNTRQVGVAGQAYVLAWDAKFEDNAGFYKVFMHIAQG